MKHNLTTQKGRLSAINDIERSFLSTLIENGFIISKDAICTVNSGYIELGIKSEKDRYKFMFSSEISLYAVTGSKYGRKDNEINFGSSGSFTPQDKAPYWRTIHAATILSNWDMACKIINAHSDMYADLEKQIFNINS